MAEKPVAGAERSGRSPPRITARLVELVARTRYQDLPEEAVRRAKNSFLDVVGTSIGGASEEGPAILGRYVREAGAQRLASVFGQRFQTTPSLAAWVNGTAGDVVGWADFSVTHMNHPSVSVAPAVWAVAERYGGTGKDALVAYVLGVEIANKICAGVKPNFQLKGWHAMGVVGTFGAAAAAGRLLQLDETRLGHALGLAAVEASGVKSSMVSMAKSYTAGRSARDGVAAGELARMGFTGPADVIEAKDGFLQTFGEGASGEGILSNLGDPFDIVHPGMTLKAFPSCTHTHTAIFGALRLREEHAFAPGDVKSVDCAVTPVVADFLRWPDPTTRLEAKFSMQFCVAVALTDARVDGATFAEERVRDAGLRKLMRKVSMRVDPERAKLGFNPENGPSGCTITIRLNDGRRLSKAVDKGPWEPETPPSWEALTSKFRANAAPTVGEAAADELSEIVHRLEKAADLRRLAELARG